MDEIDMAMRELEEEERENKNQPEPENWMKAQNYLKKRLLYIERGDGRKLRLTDLPSDATLNVSSYLLGLPSDLRLKHNKTLKQIQTK